MAMGFDGVAASVTLGSTLRHALPVSFAMWLKVTNFSASRGYFTNDRSGTNHSGVWANTGAGVPQVSFGDNTGGGSASRRTKLGVTTMSTGAWNHLVFTVRGATDMTIYLNGVDDGGAYSGTGGSVVYAGTGSIGGNSQIGRMLGQMTEVAFWSVSLSADEALALANTRVKYFPLQIQPASLRAYWPMNEFDDGATASGSNTVLDRSSLGGNIHGTPSSSPTGAAEEYLSYM